jgi:hypothetical protein
VITDTTYPAAEPMTTTIQRVAAIVESRLNNTWRPERRAMGHARMLADAGLLVGGPGQRPRRHSLPPREAATVTAPGCDVMARR